ncbi:hypothetical protein THAOC_30986, partial [Thalassiosira oceanica]
DRESRRCRSSTQAHKLLVTRSTRPWAAPRAEHARPCGGVPSTKQQAPVNNALRRRSRGAAEGGPTLAPTCPVNPPQLIRRPSSRRIGPAPQEPLRTTLRNQKLPSMRIELTTLGLLDPRSNQLSYEGDLLIVSII